LKYYLGGIQMSEVSELNDRSFDDLIRKTDKFVAVMFYTNTCPNCKAITPVYAELSDEFKSDAILTRVNAQENTILAARFGIMGVPTFKFFCSNKPIGELVGAINTTLLRNTIKDLIIHKNECVEKSTRFSWEMDGYG
jgi:thioredoxin-like negative regulator of GroEL